MNDEKKYNEALERARKLYEQGTITESLCYVFPELKESEDERIRKELIDFVKSRLAGFSQCEKMIDWLEKQGNPTDINQSEFDLRLNKLLKQFETLHKEELASSLSFYLNVVQNDGTYKDEEKQGEQKSILPKWRYKKDHTPLLRDSLILNKYMCVAKAPSGAIVSDVWVIDYDELVKLPKEEIENQVEQKPADKVEPKFKVGDEIKTKNEESFTITRIDRWGYWSEDLFICGFDDAAKWELAEQKSAWSEEDRIRIANCIQLIGKTGDGEVEWLKSLESRILPQTKQEWSEEDIKMFVNIKACLRNANKDYSREVDWLISLKDRVQPQNLTVDKDFPNAIEYTRTDAFVEKAEEFIYSALNDGIMGTANIEDFIRLFKKYMEE